MEYTHAQILDLIQFSVEEGSGEPLGETDAISIYNDWARSSISAA